MKEYFALLFSLVFLSSQAQFRSIQSIELSVGSNVTRSVIPPTGMYMHNDNLVPGLGWQLGAMINLGKVVQKTRVRTGLTVIYRHFQTNFVSFFDTNNEWYLKNERSEYHDVEVPLLLMRPFSLNHSNAFAPALGFIAGWRISELYRWRREYLRMDGVQTVENIVLRSRFNHKGPVNRFNFYASFQWQHTYESGRTLVVEPSFRFNILPLFEGSGLSGPEDETVSFGLNVGVLLNRKSKSQAR